MLIDISAVMKAEGNRRQVPTTRRNHRRLAGLAARKWSRPCAGTICVVRRLDAGQNLQKALLLQPIVEPMSVD